MDIDCRQLPDDFEDCFTSDIDILQKKPFRIFDLPPELWIKICSFAVLKPRPIVIGNQKGLKDMARMVLQPNITKTCRLLRHEALPLFYALNDIEMVHNFSVPCPRRFLHAIGATNLQNMGSLVMHSNCDIEFWKNTCERGLVKCDFELIGTKPEHMAGAKARAWRWTFRIRFT